MVQDRIKNRPHRTRRRSRGGCAQDTQRGRLDKNEDHNATTEVPHEVQEQIVDVVGYPIAGYLIFLSQSI